MAALAALAFGCSERPVLLAEPPAGVTHFVVLERGADGAAVSAPVLRAYDPDRPIWTGPDVALDLIGYAEEALRDPGELIDRPLSLAGTCSPAFGPPLWFARHGAGADALATLDPLAAPPLTAPWLEERCAAPDPDTIAVDLRECQGRCVVRARAIDACRLSIETEACGLGVFTVGYDGGVAACLASDGVTAVGCRTTPAAVDGRSVFECAAKDASGAPGPRCELEVVVPGANEPELDLVMARVAAPDPTPGRPSGDDPTGHSGPQRGELRRGRIFDLVVARRRVFVSAVAGTSRETCLDRRDQARTIRVLDAETLAEIATSTAPACLEALAPSLSGEGVAGGFSSAGAPAFGELDDSGRLLRSVTLEEGPGAAEWDVASIATVSGHYLVVLWGTVQAKLIVLDASLRRVGGYTSDSMLLEPVSLADGREILLGLVGGAGNGLARLSLPSAEELLVARPVQFGPFGPSASAVAGRRAALFSGRDKQLWVFDLPDLIRRNADGFGPVGATAGVVGAAAPWNHRGVPLIAVGGYRPDTDRTWFAELYLADLDGDRFLPIRYPIAPGVVTRVRVDEAGRIWALLPWSGEIARFTVAGR